MNKGYLYLIPSFLAETNDHRSFPPVNLEVINQLDHFIAEDFRTARRFLRKVGYNKPFEGVVFFDLGKHSDPARYPTYLDPLKNGHHVGLLSEAGIPCIADPGGAIVGLAHEMDARIVPLTGPSSIFLALMASGFNGQQFAFHGYLPIDRKEKEHKLRELERNCRASGQTQIFMETPYRNNQLLESLVKVCNESTQLCIASMLTHEQLEFIHTKPVGKWKKKLPDLHKKPAVFLMH